MRYTAIDEDSVDVVIPVYNGERFVGHAIRSVMEQTHAPHKIIVVNDGSTDGTEGVIMRLQQESAVPIDYIKQENGGLSSARNAGIRVARSQYIAFLDADDEWCSEKLFEQLAVFRTSSFEKLGVVYCRYRIIDERGEYIKHHIALPRSDMRGHVFSKLLKGNAVISSGSGVLVRRECFESAGLFDEQLRAAEDWDMWLRIAEQYQFDFVPDKDLVKIRMHGSNMQKNAAHMFRNELIFYDKWSIQTRQSGKSFVVPVVWGNSIAYKLVRSLPDGREFFLLIRQHLTKRARSRIFRYTLGSVKLHVFAMVVYMGLADLWSVIRKSVQQCRALITL